MDIKCILEEGLRINATCSFETLRLREDGYDRDAYRNRTQLNVEFTLGILDEETDSYEEKTVASMKFYIFKYREYDEIDEISDVTGYDNMMGVDTAMKYFDMCKKNPDGNDTYEYISSGGNINVCYLHEFYINTEYRGQGLSEYLLCMIPTILNEYLGIVFGFVSTHIRPYKYQGRIEGDVLSKIEYDDDNAELMKIMEKPLLKVGFVQIGEGYDFATDLQSLDHNAMERDIEAVFTGRYFGYNYE